MIIDCGSCSVAGAACDDCVVTVLLGVPEVPSLESSGPTAPMMVDLGADGLEAEVASGSEAMTASGSVSGTIGVPTELPDEHAAALAVLADSGLIPPLRLVPFAS